MEMKESGNHKNLTVWERSIELAEEIYKITQKFPKEELYGIVSQIRRAAVSVSANIAEGAARNSNKEYVQFLYISLGSLSELETELIISKRVGYLKDERIFDKLIDVKKLLLGLIKYRKGLQ